MNRPLLHFIRGVGEKMPYVRRKTHGSLWRQRLPAAHRCTDRWATSLPPARALIPAGGPICQRQRCHAAKTDWRSVCKVKHLKPLKVQHFIEQETSVCFLITKIFAGCSQERHTFIIQHQANANSENTPSTNPNPGQQGPMALAVFFKICFAARFTVHKGTDAKYE